MRLAPTFNDALLRQIESHQDEITIGRNADNDIQIDNMAVSGYHARILKDADHHSIEDLNSTNGTFVNEEKITTRVLKENDKITIGKHTLIVAPEIRREIKTGKPNGIEKTYVLETLRHKKMLKKQPEH